MGLHHIFFGSAQTTLDTMKEILEDLDMVQQALGEQCNSKRIINKEYKMIKNTMSDRHAAEKLFNELLSEYRADILPEIIEN